MSNAFRSLLTAKIGQTKTAWKADQKFAQFMMIQESTMKSSQSPYMLVQSVKAPGAPWLETIENVPDEEDLAFGVSRISGFPKDASFSMSDDYPKDVGLADVFKNVSALLVVSDRLRQCLESLPGALFDNEVLPVKIVNHKKRAEKAPYFIIHQINHPPCLDEKKTQGTRMPINPKKFQFVTAMVLDEKKIDTKKMLFRVDQFPDVPIIRRDLAEKLKAEKFTGLEFREIEGFNFLLA